MTMTNEELLILCGWTKKEHPRPRESRSFYPHEDHRDIWTAPNGYDTTQNPPRPKDNLQDAENLLRERLPGRSFGVHEFKDGTGLGTIIETDEKDRVVSVVTKKSPHGAAAALCDAIRQAVEMENG